MKVQFEPASHFIVHEMLLKQQDILVILVFR